ncbi:DUF3696 domain-containing protein [Larkinella sp. GY13]|uniref:DUF3696 domain-containing protein n=1 Tax=Larkinella sp. GY13 TaxID=3453720 RepID=UPI003EED1884
MLINSLSLENFKCFEKLDVKFAPITLLTGANSSGKSSLIYSLLAVVQSKSFPFFISPNGNYINMGSFDEMIFNGSKRKRFKIETKFSIRSYNDENNELKIFTSWVINNKNNLPKLSEIKIYSPRILFEIKKIKKEYFFTFNGRVTTNEIVNDKPQIFNGYIDNEKVDFKIIHKSEAASLSFYILDVTFKNLKLSIDIDKFIEILSDSSNWTIFDIFNETTELFNTVEEEFNYIGSFRKPPERTYYQKTKSEKIGTSGESYIDQIIEWEEGNTEKFNELLGFINEMQLLNEIRATKFAGGRFELGVKPHSKGKIAALTDVGFGISQFLPIIVADLQMDSNSCLAISQPEIHLHPKIQAIFGNYLSNQIKKSGKQYIIETHSEYLLNRIRLLLVTGELKPEDVKVYYFENDGIKSTVHDVEFTTSGAVKNAPDGFFETYEMDVMDIALNAVK